MIYIKIDNDTFYDDAIVLVRSFYPRMEVKAYKQDTVATEADKVIDITVPDMTGLNKSECTINSSHIYMTGSAR